MTHEMTIEEMLQYRLPVELEDARSNTVFEQEMLYREMNWDEHPRQIQARRDREQLIHVVMDLAGTSSPMDVYWEQGSAYNQSLQALEMYRFAQEMTQGEASNELMSKAEAKFRKSFSTLVHRVEQGF